MRILPQNGIKGMNIVGGMLARSIGDEAARTGERG
jgi:hypothetical protein